MKLYGLKNCDSCKKALSGLRAAGYQVDFMDIRATPLDASQLADLLKHHGDALVVNRKSTTWRTLDDAARAQPVQKLLSDHPTLIKRPVIYTDTASHVGWNADVKAALGL